MTYDRAQTTADGNNPNLAKRAVAPAPTLAQNSAPPPLFRRSAPHVRTSLQNIDDVLWKDAGCTSELDYTEQTSWLLFLKYLDALEHDKATEAALNGKKYTPILDKPCRWETWAAPKGKDGKIDHNTAQTAPT
jgi:hypothetical protein